jgi:hypothetical protein
MLPAQTISLIPERQDFSPLAALGLKILDRGGILQKPLPAAQACGCFVCSSLESELSLPRTKKPLTQ